MTAADPAREDLQTLHEPWPDRALQMQAFTFGLWCFLATELLFFGGMFASFSVARHLHHAGFNAGTRETSLLYGTINTAVLLTSSLTMAIAERGSEAGMRRLAQAMLAATLLLGLTFLVVKGLEYREDLQKHLWPGRDFSIPVSGAALFFALYWMMTAVHGVHVIVGLTLVARVSWIALRGGLPSHKVSVRMTTLYWHLVDVIWVVLFPLLYLGADVSAERDALKAVVLTPLLVWVALLILLTMTVAYALWPAGGLKPAVALSISAAKAMLIGVVFMRLNKATPLIRLAAGAGLVWLCILFAMLFVDYMTRAA